jgi:hypothetical protein
MNGHVAAIFSHPIKCFTPEALKQISLDPDEGLAMDRVWAVENGPSGYNPEAPSFTPKQKFTVLAAIPRVAAVRTRLDDSTGALTAQAPGTEILPPAPPLNHPHPLTHTPSKATAPVKVPVQLPSCQRALMLEGQKPYLKKLLPSTYSTQIPTA